MEFIEFRLLWEGRVNRPELVRHFGISVPQASLDLSRYAEMAPANLLYDKQAKTYVAGPSFAPVLSSAESQWYLAQLWSLEAGVGAPQQSFIGWRPPCEVVTTPARKVDNAVLVGLLRAIRLKLQIDVEYQSLSRLEPSARTIEPHALAHDGNRWHVRAWCCRHQEFRDFVVSRIHRAGITRPATADSQTDQLWHAVVALQIAPKPDLGHAQRLAVEREYGMVSGVLRVPVRAAMLHYLVRHLQLDRLPADPNAPPIVWKNRAELEHHLIPNVR